MSWPGGFSGGGQIFPQPNHMQHTNARQLQIMQMQMQLQRKIQLQKQQLLNSAKNQGRDNQNGNPNMINKNANINASKNAGSQAAVKDNSTTTAASGVDNRKANENHSGKEDQNKTVFPGSDSRNSQSVNKTLTNQPPPANTNEKSLNKTQPRVKIEPPSPNTQRQDVPKSSLLGQPPLVANPPPLVANPPPLMAVPPPPQESKDDKMSFSKDFRMQNQQQSLNSNIQNNRPGNYNDHQNQSNDHQQGNRGGGSRWSQPSGPRSGPQNDWQNQAENKSYNPPQENAPNSDYSRGASGGVNYQGSIQDRVQYNRPGRNMNASNERPKNVPPHVKRETKGNYGYDPKGYYGMGGRFKEKMDMTFSEPLTNLEAIDTSEKKFNAFAKVFVGNIPKNIDQEELLAVFKPFGEIGPTYINKDSAFGFLTFDYKANAAKAVREADNHCLKNRYLKVRFAAINEGLRVRNLSPYVSNELLEKAFSVFGAVESCRVLVDDRGNPKFEGIVIFKEKRCAALALKKCQEECYYLSGAMRPIIATALEPCEDNVESVPESVIPQNEEYHSERKVPPHFADQSSFEFEFGNQWKKLFEMYDEKKSILDRDFQIELERLEKKMVLAKVEYETEKLRKELAEREAQTAQLRRHFGSDEFPGRSGSPGQFNPKGSSAAAYDGAYGGMNQGYDVQYGEGYENMGGYGKPGVMGSSSGADFDRGYNQQGYTAGYGRDEYGREAGASGYGDEPKYDRSSGGYDRGGDTAITDSKPAPPIRQKYESIPEPPSFKNSPEPLMGKDPYQGPSKRPRY